MLNHKLLGSVSSLPQDDNFENVTLLLSGDGTNGAQNNTFLDSSTNNFTITRNGNTTQGSFSPYGDLWSNYFDGSGDYLTATLASAVSSTTFTVEAWVNASAIDSVNGNHIIQVDTATPTTNICLSYDATQFRFFLRDNSGTTTFDLNASVLTVGQWYHVVGVKSGANAALFINGTRVASTTSATNPTTTGTNLRIASNANSGGNTRFWNGYISNARIVSGTAVYDPTATTITVPTAPLSVVSGTRVLTCQSNRFLDLSSDNLLISPFGNTSVQRFSPFNPTEPYSTSVIGGSGYFDGSGDYLSVADNAALKPTGDFTYECWVYCTSSPTGLPIAVFGGNSNTVATIAFDVNGSGYFRFFSGTNSTTNDVAITSSVIPALNSWYYLAATRSGNTYTFYVNGTSVGTASQSAARYTSGTINYIGGQSGSTFSSGYIAGLRIVNGTALSISVPTAPPTAVANTSLLTNFTNAGIPDLAMMNDLETVGNAQVSTSVKKYGTGSLAFDGTGDYLSIPNNPITQPGSASFTIEGWIYLNTTSGNQTICAKETTDAYNIFWFLVESGKLRIKASTNGSTYGIDMVGATTLSATTWYHFALVRNGSTWTIYLNGVSDASGTLSGTIFNDASSFTVGFRTPGSTNYLNGYIDDLRITKGLARYTTTFTPPASALPTY